MTDDAIEIDDNVDLIVPETKPMQMAFAYSFRVETPNQLIDIMTQEDVYLPVNIGLNQMANIRFVIFTHRFRQIPFDIIKIDNFWFIDQVFHDDLDKYLKRGDRLLIINKTMISDELQETDIFKLILHSPLPFIVWVTWDADAFLKHQVASRQCSHEDAYVNAKAYLLKTKCYRDTSLYDHLSFVLANAIQSSPDNLGDLFENLSRNTPKVVLQSTIRDVSDTDLSMLKIHSQLLQGTERDRLKSDDYTIKGVPDLMELSFFCSSAGFGIHPTEILLVWSAMKRLSNRIECTEMKFWGKIFGLHCDYYIVQVLHDKEIAFDEIDIIEQSVGRKRSLLKHDVLGSNKPSEKVRQYYFAELSAEINRKASIEIPSEPHGTGTNQYTYFVTNSPGLPWTKLPDVKPAMIDHARKLRCMFTGCLSAHVNGFPPFVGLEKDYLRAQIARITATTHISPAGFYIVSDNGEEEEEEETSAIDERKGASIELNPEYNSDPTNQSTAETLANENLQEWVHSAPEVLPQGRTRFWRSPVNRAVRSENDEETMTESDSTVTADLIQVPAPLLQPISDDNMLHTDQNPWSIGLTMAVMHEYSLCYVRSNIWPGAFTLGNAITFFNLYIGWGQKYESFEPARLPLPELEFAEDLVEENDPSVELEHAAEEARRAAAELSAEEYASEESEEEITDDDY